MKKLTENDQDEAKALWSEIFAHISALMKEGCGGKSFVITEEATSDTLKSRFKQLKSRSTQES